MLNLKCVHYSIVDQCYFIICHILVHSFSRYCKISARSTTEKQILGHEFQPNWYRYALLKEWSEIGKHLNYKVVDNFVSDHENYSSDCKLIHSFSQYSKITERENYNRKVRSCMLESLS